MGKEYSVSRPIKTINLSSSNLDKVYELESQIGHSSSTGSFNLDGFERPIRQAVERFLAKRSKGYIFK